MEYSTENLNYEHLLQDESVKEKYGDLITRTREERKNRRRIKMVIEEKERLAEKSEHGEALEDIPPSI